MKKLLSFMFVTTAFVAVAQPKKAPKMAPVLAQGYYVNIQKSDTVRGEIMTNPDDVTDFYKGFSFKPAKGGKVMPVDSKKAKAYGFEGRNFVLIDNSGEPIYAEVLAKGRLNFFECRYHGKNKDGNPDILSAYFIQDNMGEGEFAKLKDVKKINNTFYKKDLKDFMRDQPMIWNDLDKFTLDEQKVVNAINEFNKFYQIKGSED